jgi:hypothetical protein
MHRSFINQFARPAEEAFASAARESRRGSVLPQTQ